MRAQRGKGTRCQVGAQRAAPLPADHGTLDYHKPGPKAHGVFLGHRTLKIFTLVTVIDKKKREVLE
ncbi:MAG: hypothetical protein D6736_01770 [Nitrospinota bacterium]|nr:MAG: hypothetical protein D6736_01770 [Nitrospinota bacterium]